jgi:hypothetical protein
VTHMAKRNARPPLMVRVWAELGSGNITEDPDLRSDVKGERLHGLQEGRHIWVNPVHAIVDTVVHECLHRLHPEWSENYVRNRTSYLVSRMTDAEVVALYDEYQHRKKLKRRQRDPGGVRSRGGRTDGAGAVD